MASQEHTTTPQQPGPETVPASSDSAMPSSPAPAKQDNETAASQQSTDSKPTSPPPPPPNPRLAALTAKYATLQATLTSLQHQRSALIAEAKLPSGLAMPAEWSEEQKTKQAFSTANAVIKEHIGLLHKYNEMKDIGQGLMGMIADKRGVRVGTVMEEFEMGEKD
ncbi:hypothetical protein LTR36_005868 [Oleoguttula mirabilis]|uniref:Swi5-domain-containing protein n=1 Tax=Oleoguttula mirabilis TaxID=1507867 RepID=A0AAV9JDZ0_9PEZI|nr:hypothetical protein LTR36_005868 [Oleoguttula mirabilis]